MGQAGSSCCHIVQHLYAVRVRGGQRVWTAACGCGYRLLMVLMMLMLMMVVGNTGHCTGIPRLNVMMMMTGST